MVLIEISVNLGIQKKFHTPCALFNLLVINDEAFWLKLSLSVMGACMDLCVCVLVSVCVFPNFLAHLAKTQLTTKPLCCCRPIAEFQPDDTQHRHIQQRVFHTFPSTRSTDSVHFERDTTIAFRYMYNHFL